MAPLIFSHKIVMILHTTRTAHEVPPAFSTRATCCNGTMRRRCSCFLVHHHLPPPRFSSVRGANLRAVSSSTNSTLAYLSLLRLPTAQGVRLPKRSRFNQGTKVRTCSAVSSLFILSTFEYTRPECCDRQQFFPLRAGGNRRGSVTPSPFASQP